MPFALYNSANSQCKAGDHTKAIDNINVLLKLPKTQMPPGMAASAWEVGARARLGLGEFDRAEDNADRAIALNSEVAWYFATRAYIRLARGKTFEALADANKAIALDEQFSYAYELRASIYEKKGESVKAAADRETAKRFKVGVSQN